jgi:hypothetical protein
MVCVVMFGEVDERELANNSIASITCLGRIRSMHSGNPAGVGR